MSKWCSYGWLPANSPDAERAREIEDELFREYLPILLGNSERILEMSRFFYCQPADAWLSSMWLYGGGPIPLGVLLLLWEAGEMLFDCPSCGGSLYAIGVAGSILSGSGCASGVCNGCRKTQRAASGSFSSAINTVGKLLPRYRNEPIIEKGKSPVFDWKEGLKGESTPDRVIVPAVDPADLWTLIRELTGFTGEEDGESAAILARAQHKAASSETSRVRGITSPIRLEKKRR